MGPWAPGPLGPWAPEPPVYEGHVPGQGPRVHVGGAPEAELDLR